MNDSVKSQESSNPVVSVVVVSDYAGGESKAWGDLRATLAALARQDFEEPAEFLLTECVDFKEKIPPDIATILPVLKILFSPTSSSYALKNDGARNASADIVVLLDADCIPDSDWLRHLVNAFRSHPNAAAVSGRTVYAGGTLMERVLALLARSYLDPGRPGRTRFISNNNAGFRRSIYLAHPLRTDNGPFASRLQSESILRDGGQLFFEPRMRVAHDFQGWTMEKDIRRNIGYATIITRLLDRLIPHAWLTRLGFASIPVFVAAKTVDSCWDCIRCGRYYGVKWYQLPFAFCVSMIVACLFLRVHLQPVACRYSRTLAS